MNDEKISSEALEDKENESVSDNNDRPPVDPHNKLYTVITLLIFAVIYGGFQYLKANFTLETAYYDNSINEQQAEVFLSEIGMDELPEGAELKYVRMHRNFDNDAVYIALSVNEDFESFDENADEYVRYEYARAEEGLRYTVYPMGDMNADYVYGNSYVSIENPGNSCLVYEEEDESYTALYRVCDYSVAVSESFKDSEKINVK